MNRGGDGAITIAVAAAGAPLATFAEQFRVVGAADTLLAAWRHIFKHAGGKRMIRVLERLDRTKMSEEVRTGHDGVLTYPRDHAGRMDYPSRPRRGWRIGSGAVESACETVVHRRPCLGGMRWGEEGSDAVGRYTAAMPTSGKRSGRWPRSSRYPLI